MTTQDLLSAAEKLEHRIAAADEAERLALQPEFSKVLERLEAEGQQVPAHLRRLDAALIDEAVEARFDNMPV